MSFIEVNNNMFYFSENESKDICRELINTNSITHVYIMLPQEEALCIEWKDKHGRCRDVIESFESRGRCINRFNEISRMLCKGGKK